MVTLGPARALKSVGAEGNYDNRQEQSEKGDAVNSQDRHVAGHVDGVQKAGKQRISLRLNAQIVVTARDARDHDSVNPLSLAPGTIAVVAMVIAHFAAEVPGLSGVLIDKRIVQIDPVVVHGSGSFHFHGCSVAGEFEHVGDERSLAFRVGANQLKSLMKDWLLFRTHIETGHERAETNRH